MFTTGKRIVGFLGPLGRWFSGLRLPSLTPAPGASPKAWQPDLASHGRCPIFSFPQKARLGCVFAVLNWECEFLLSIPVLSFPLIGGLEPNRVPRQVIRIPCPPPNILGCFPQKSGLLNLWGGMCVFVGGILF